jgi:hypothetical protein
MPAPSTAELLAQRLGVPCEHVVQRKESGSDYSEPGASTAAAPMQDSTQTAADRVRASMADAPTAAGGILAALKGDQAQLGLGRVVALYDRASALYWNRYFANIFGSSRFLIIMKRQ